jgi:hypothetical protein
MENKIKLTCVGNTSLLFIENENGEVNITKNNYQDIAVLSLENIIELHDFLNTFKILQNGKSIRYCRTCPKLWNGKPSYLYLTKPKRID